MQPDRFYGIYRGRCTNSDPVTMRIKANISQCLGNTEETTWAEPCVPPAWTGGVVKPHTSIIGPDPQGGSVVSVANNNHVVINLTPQVGDTVWIMFIDGDIDYPVWMGVRP